MTRLLLSLVVCALGLLLLARRREPPGAAADGCTCGHVRGEHQRALPGGPYPAPCHHGWADGGPGCRCGGWDDDLDWLEQRRTPHEPRGATLRPVPPWDALRTNPEPHVDWEARYRAALVREWNQIERRLGD